MQRSLRCAADTNAAPPVLQRGVNQAAVEWFKTLDVIALLDERARLYAWNGFDTSFSSMFTKIPDRKDYKPEEEFKGAIEWGRALASNDELPFKNADESWTEAETVKQMEAFFYGMKQRLIAIVKAKAEAKPSDASGILRLHYEGGGTCYWYTTTPVGIYQPAPSLAQVGISVMVPQTDHLEYTINHTVFNHRRTTDETISQFRSYNLSTYLLDGMYLLNLPSQWVLLHAPGQSLESVKEIAAKGLTIGPTVGDLRGQYELHTLFTVRDKGNGTLVYNTYYTHAWMEYMEVYDPHIKDAVEWKLWQAVSWKSLTAQQAGRLGWSASTRLSEEVVLTQIVHPALFKDVRVLGSYWRAVS